MSCRLCGAEDTTRIVERSDLTLDRCGACGFVSGTAVGARTPEERYAHYYDAPQAPAPVSRYDEWLRRAEAEIGRGRLLEVGSGSGGFLRVALQRGWQVDAVEVSRSALELLRATGVRVFAGELHEAGHPDASFDLAVSLEVVEHLERPLDHLKELGRVLRPGGRLLMTTPHFDGLSRRWLGLRWRVVDPEHLGYFNRRSLRWALARAGFAEATLVARSLDVTAWRPGSEGATRFDPHASASLRDRVEGSLLLRTAKAVVNAALAFTGLGDSLHCWARR